MRGRLPGRTCGPPVWSVQLGKHPRGWFLPSPEVRAVTSQTLPVGGVTAEAPGAVEGCLWGRGHGRAQQGSGVPDTPALEREAAVCPVWAAGPRAGSGVELGVQPSRGSCVRDTGPTVRDHLASPDPR